jgi:N-methylhydantoinase A
MARAVRSVSIERGRDVRRYALVAFGGAGPLHACALARELDIGTVIVPPSPGALAALGLLVASRRADVALSRPGIADRTRDVELRTILSGLTDTVVGELRDEGVALSDVRVSLVVDCRYEGQSHELRVPVEGGPSFALINEAFRRLHEMRFGFTRPRARIEAVTYRATALGPVGEVDIATPSGSPVEPVRARIAGVDANVYERSSLPSGAEIAGPALITEADSTTWIDQGSVARVHGSGALIVSVSS